MRIWQRWAAYGAALLLPASLAMAQSADLSVAVTGPAIVVQNTTITLNVVLTNNGPDTSASGGFLIFVSPGMTFDSFLQTGGPAAGSPLPAGATETFTINLHVNPGVANGTVLTNTFLANSITSDPNAGNDTLDFNSTVIPGTADLAVTKNGPATGATLTNLVYTLGVANNGPDEATGVTLSDVLPPGTTFVSLVQNTGPAFACTTPAIGATGPVSCSIGVLGNGATAGFTLTVATGSTPATVSNTATVTGTTTDPNGANDAANVSTAVSAVTTFTGSSPVGSGTITATFTGGGAGCSYSTARFIPASGDPASPPAGSAPRGVQFPFGLFDFTLSGCAPASTVSFTITYPNAVPANAKYWKYGPTAASPTPHWYELPATIAGTVATFSITDGGLGDDDLTANGTLVDQGGPGAGSADVPTLNEWMLLLLAAVLGSVGLAAIRRNAA